MIPTLFLNEDKQQASDSLKDFSHDDSGGGKEPVPWKRAHISDAEDERSILYHKDC